MRQQHIVRFIERYLVWFVLLLLLLYTYASFVAIPYLGFNFIQQSGMVTAVWDERASPDMLEIGDVILAVNRGFR
jgi:branched-subunit amino acid transport protein AzlD